MNCPAHVQIFKHGIKSYRDLPIRMAEMGCCHHNEAHGALHGLMRVRQMTQDDAHIFCREDQIGEESKTLCGSFKDVYNDFGFTNIKLFLATRPEKRAGTDETWDKAEKSMADAFEWSQHGIWICPGRRRILWLKYEFHFGGLNWTHMAMRHLPIGLCVTWTPWCILYGRRRTKHRPWWFTARSSGHLNALSVCWSKAQQEFSRCGLHLFNWWFQVLQNPITKQPKHWLQNSKPKASA